VLIQKSFNSTRTQVIRSHKLHSGEGALRVFEFMRRAKDPERVDGGRSAIGSRTAAVGGQRSFAPTDWYDVVAPIFPGVLPGLLANFDDHAASRNAAEQVEATRP
jgi:hypothetical protein